MFSRAICWLRRDLRLTDHVALAAATAQAHEVAVVFVFDRLILDALEDRDDRRVTFLHQSLREIDTKLRALGSRLIVLHGDPVQLIPALGRELGAEALFFNHDFEPYALERDEKVRETFPGEVHTFKDHVIFERKEVLSGSGMPFRVFTPFSRAWRARLTPGDVQEHRVDLSKAMPLSEPYGLHPIATYGFKESTLWLEPGEDAAHARLGQFLVKIDRYEDARNHIDQDGTSGLSVHLRHGTLSIRACVRAALEARGDKWLSELIWRDFYQIILAEFPHVVGGSFKPELDAIEWPGTEEHFQAWCAGQTGYPIVDAAMRCFNATGWMHNRARMIVAMFLTKDLLVDWRRGEAYFARYLLDFDLAANNGGWQWSASTGVDAQPYFRIFNPVLQSEKFDPEGRFIAEWCPELAPFDPKRRHWPHDATPFECLAAGCTLGEDYPHPIVVHAEQKPKALALFKM